MQPTHKSVACFFGACVILAGLVGCGGDSAPSAPANPPGVAPTTEYRHGQTVILPGPFGDNPVHRSFLGGSTGRIETTTTEALVGNGEGWTFNNLGGPTRVAQDAVRGKVLFTPQSPTAYNAVRRYDPGFAIGEQRHFYKAHYVRNVLLLDGLPYSKSYQWKHERVNWVNSVVDGDCEFKVHSWLNSQGVTTIINRGPGDSTTFWGGTAADSNGGWAMLEMLVYTGLQGQSDGKVITRVFKNGKTWISENQQAERIYATPDLRLRYFVEQNYFGNFGQVEDGVDNALPRPDVRELYSDDSLVLIGENSSTGWRRIELRDHPDLKQATVRELQTWNDWQGDIRLTLNVGGLPAGVHDLYLVVIAGVDQEGWDIVEKSIPIRVRVL